MVKGQIVILSTIALQRLACSEQLQRKKEIRSQTEKCNSLQTVEREQYFCLVASEDNLCHIQTKKHGTLALFLSLRSLLIYHHFQVI